MLRQWDEAGKASRLRLLAALLRRCELAGGDYDVPRLSRELSDQVGLLVPRVVSMLQANLKLRKYPFHFHVKCLCALLMTSQGQELAEKSPRIMETLAQTLEIDQLQDKSINQEKDLVTALVMLKKLCSLSEQLRKSLLSFRAMSLISTLQQKMNWSSAVQDAACHLLLDLASVDDNSALALSHVFRKLLNSSQIYTKMSAVKMWTCILHTNSAVVICLDGWESEALEQLTRLLLCGPLSIQYDVSELIALLFLRAGYDDRTSEGLEVRLMQRVGAVMCLRYTLGGSAIVQPPPDWNMKFFLGDVIEAPEV